MSFIERTVATPWRAIGVKCKDTPELSVCEIYLVRWQFMLFVPNGAPCFWRGRPRGRRSRQCDLFQCCRHPHMCFFYSLSSSSSFNRLVHPHEYWFKHQEAYFRKFLSNWMRSWNFTQGVLNTYVFPRAEVIFCFKNWNEKYVLNNFQNHHFYVKILVFKSSFMRTFRFSCFFGRF